MLFEKIQLEPNEEVLHIVRRHWFLLFIEMVAIVIMAAAPFVLFAVLVFVPTLSPLLQTLVDTAAIGPLSVGALSLWFLMTTIAAYMIWTHYYLDLWIITDRRIIMIDQVRFFDRRVSSFRLERLQDLSVVMSGIIETFLNFGSIRAQTAATRDDHFRMNGLPDPRSILGVIQSATDRRLTLKE
jgi:hypothetical protein